MKAVHAIRSVLSERIVADQRLHILGEALELSPATQGLMALAPERVHLLPAADATLLGLATGLALDGKRVVVSLSDSAAIWGALQQLGQEAAALHANAEFRPTLVVRVPWSPDRPDPSELLTAIPGLSLAAAGGPSDAAELLAAALDAGGTTVILEPGLALLGHQAETATSPRPLGQAALLREGDHATLLCWGPGVGAASRAADTLSAEGIEVDVVDLRSLAPLDTTTIAARVGHTGRPVLAGAPASILAAVVDQAFLRLESPPVVVPPDADAIAQAVRTSVTF